MKILYDNQIATSQNMGGINRYFSELQKHIINLGQTEFQQVEKPYISKPKIAKSFFGKIKSINALVKHDFDIFHPTYYNPYFLPFLQNKPFVLTVFDMIHEKYPQYFGATRQTSIMKRLLIARANKIICISNSTKSDLLDLYPWVKDRTSVIYLGNTRLKTNNSSKKNTDTRFILFVGNRNYYKNFIFMIHSIHKILLSEKLQLICVGGGSFSNKETEIIRGFGLEKLVKQIEALDSNLCNLYQHALCMIYPSEYEGFGLPILEAMDNGCPVICSPVSSLPEVVGSAAIYFKQGDSDDLCSAVKDIVGGGELRKKLSILGRKQVKKFSWQKTAKETLSVYKELLKENIK